MDERKRRDDIGDAMVMTLKVRASTGAFVLAAVAVGNSGKFITEVAKLCVAMPRARRQLRSSRRSHRRDVELEPQVR
jgi:hypothetical protein